MELKRFYVRGADGNPVKSPVGGGAIGEYQISHFGVVETGVSREQRQSHQWVARGLAEGWLTLEGKRITVKAEPEDLRYEIVREPGYYCVSTGERIPISQIAWQEALTKPIAVLAAREAQAWCVSHGKPAGDYEAPKWYELLLDEEQHEKFKAMRAFGGLVAAHKHAQIMGARRG